MQVDTVLEVVNSIYGAAVSENSWHKVLVDLADLAGMENAALVVTDTRAAYSSVVTPRSRPEIVDQYLTTWWQKDVTAHATATKPVGMLTTLEDTGRETFFSSEFYNDFWRTSGLGAERVAANLMVDDGAFASLVLQASCKNDEITSEAAGVFRCLVPHFVRAVAIQRKRFRLQSQRDLAIAVGGRTDTGAMLLCRDGCLVAADDFVEELLRQPAGMKLDQGAICLANLEDTHKLTGLVRSCAEITSGSVQGGVLEARAADGGHVLRLDVMPYKGQAAGFDFHGNLGAAPVAIVLVERFDECLANAPKALNWMFGLTPAEALLALEIAKGDGRQAAANRLGISVSTVRTHLTRVFEKTGATRQAELVRLLSEKGFDV